MDSTPSLSRLRPRGAYAPAGRLIPLGCKPYGQEAEPGATCNVQHRTELFGRKLLFLDLAWCGSV